MLSEEPTWLPRRVLFIGTMHGGVFILESCQLPAKFMTCSTPLVPSHRQRKEPSFILFFKWKDVNSVLARCAP